MELPPALRQRIDEILKDVDVSTLKRDAEALSRRYRAELRDGRMHLAEDGAVAAYLATRMPATYAAIRASVEALAVARPDFNPAGLLDIGAGPGAALWAVRDRWPDLEKAMLVEGSAAARKIGERLAKPESMNLQWVDADITRGLSPLAPADLVTMSYVLDEIDESERARLITRLWSLTDNVLLIVEPGTPAGWDRIIAAREQLLAKGAHLLAPCAHAKPCPLAEPDWCHFARRVARSRLHRFAKGGDVPWEDEKYIFIAVSRSQAESHHERVLAPPRRSSGRVELKLCLEDGTAAHRLISRRDGDLFKRARRVGWGDAL